MLVWTVSHGTPHHQWFVKRGFRRFLVNWYDSEKAYNLDAVVGHFRRRAVRPRANTCFVFQLMQSHRNGFTDDKRLYEEPEKKLSLVAVAPETDALAYRLEHYGEKYVEDFGAVGEMLYAELRAMTDNLQGPDRMPPEVYVDWLREKLPIVENFLAVR